MRAAWWVGLVIVGTVGCSCSRGQAPAPSTGSAPPTGSAAPTGSDGVALNTPDSAEAPDATASSPDAAAPMPDAGTSSGGLGKLTYQSDCSLTHPIARNYCDSANGPAPDKRGLKSCASLHIKANQHCKSGTPSCYVEEKCGDGKVVISDFLECVEKQSERCFTKSSRTFKQDIEYLTSDELADLEHQVTALRLARFHYKDASDAQPRLGFINEDAKGAPFITTDGKRVDLYSLLAASIAAIQQQNARIEKLERDIQQCKGVR